jgi:hypothetical protein
MARQIRLEFWKGYPKRIIYGFTDHTRNQEHRRIFVMNETFKKLLEPQVKNKHVDRFDWDAPDADRAYSVIDHWIPDDVFMKSNNEVIEYLNSIGDKSIVASDQTKDLY